MRNTKPPVVARSPGPRAIEVLAQKKFLDLKKFIESTISLKKEYRFQSRE
jgi:hypothetical protein